MPAHVPLSPFYAIITCLPWHRGAQVYIIENPSMKMIASSDSSFMPLSNTTVGDRIVATEARNDLMRMSSRFLNHSGFPDEVVFVHNGYWLQCRWFTDKVGLDWRIVTVQEIDCDPGYKVGADNQTWYVTLSEATLDSSMFSLDTDDIAHGL